ncbi:MAG: T9SS type A sorting domain-containing protein [Bacteroidales bacterium]|nr:T9SS type A sorting domain-containing protein [Bacteroidales bacterium]
MRRYSIYLLFSIILAIATSQAQTFTNINAGLTGLHFSDVAWGDYDADGDLDLLIAGLDAGELGVTILYKNEGNDTFTAVTGLGIPGTYVGDFTWGDYDADGDLDILIQGYTDSGEITALFENLGGDIFSDSGLNFTVYTDGAVNFVDFNNDGLLDIFMAGYDGEAYSSKLYKNVGNGDYSVISTPIPGAIKSSYEWADYNNDGFIDLFMSGFDFSATLISKLYTNNGDETFTESENSFAGAWLGDVSWGDYDSDGDLDILLSGHNLDARIAKVYKNNNDGTFTEVTTANLTGVSHCSTIWGDYDNDGDLDVFIAGTYESTSSWVRVTDVFINNGDDTFTAAGLSFSTDAYWGESAWGDYDNDGDLDLVCCGFDDQGGSNTYIYRNEAEISNTAPSEPQNPVTELIGNTVTLSWEVASDNETSSEGLTYNAYIRNSDGTLWWPPMSMLESGKRMIPAIGNVNQNLQFTVTNLSNGTYFWSVQALDNCFEGSIFTEEQMFQVGTTGIGITSEDPVQIYPVPSEGKFYLKIKSGLQDNSVITILNNQGETVYLQNLPRMQTEFNSIVDLSYLPGGFYFVHFSEGANYYIKKLIIN